MKYGSGHKELEYQNLKLIVPKQVYFPSDDTYILAENLKVKYEDEVLEVGCGCGIISLLAARFAKRVVASDLNPFAVKATRENAKINNLINKIDVICGDLFQPFHEDGKFSLIIFNPPYLPHADGEPEGILERAWCGGKQGREIIDEFLKKVAKFLKDSGRILLVQSTLSNVNKTIQKMIQSGFSVKEIAAKKFDFETIILIEAKKP